MRKGQLTSVRYSERQNTEILNAVCFLSEPEKEIPGTRINWYLLHLRGLLPKTTQSASCCSFRYSFLQHSIKPTEYKWFLFTIPSISQLAVSYFCQNSMQTAALFSYEEYFQASTELALLLRTIVSLYIAHTCNLNHSAQSQELMMSP